MKRSLVAALLTLLLLPTTSFARDWRDYDRRDYRRDRYSYDRRDAWRDRYNAERQARDAFEQQHPRWPRSYCHRHQIPLNRDDTRRHCHNWNTEDRYDAHNGPFGWPWW